MNNTREKIIAKVSQTFKAQQKERNGYAATHVRIEAQAYQFSGNERPHFSVQTDIATNDRFSDYSTVACGCIHDVAARYWPEIKPIIDLHLSNADGGEPMHAEANGWYWFAGAFGGLGERYHGGNSTPSKTPEECLQILADHLRLGINTTRAVCEDFHDKGKQAAKQRQYKTNKGNTHKNAVISEETRKLFREWIDGQHERWAREAKAGLLLIKELA